MFFGHVHGKILSLILQHPWAWVSFHHVQRTDPDSKSLSLLLPYFTLRPFCACQDSFAYLQLACLSLVLPHGPRPNDLKGLADHNLALNMSKAVRQMKFWRCPLASSRFHKKNKKFLLYPNFVLLSRIQLSFWGIQNMAKRERQENFTPKSSWSEKQ